MNSFIAVIIQQRLLIDQCAKMNLLAYATGNFLEHLGALVGCERLSASNADAPENFSCAGSAGAYISHTKEVSQLIVDVAVDSPIPGDVRIFPLMKGGELPHDEILQTVYEHLNEKTIRPLIDRVFVLPPEIVEYNIDVSYWISRDEAISAAAIEQNFQAAAQDYIGWQCSKLGKDINPSELIHKIKSAGADRIDVREPIFTVLEKIQVAKLNNFNLVFEGLKEN